MKTKLGQEGRIKVIPEDDYNGVKRMKEKSGGKKVLRDYLNIADCLI